MAHKKAGGSTTNGRESRSKRLGIKKYAGEYVKSGSILVRQRGTKFHPGVNVEIGKDDTLFSTIRGIVNFTTKKVRKYNNQLKETKFVNVVAPQK